MSLILSLILYAGLFFILGLTGFMLFNECMLFVFLMVDYNLRSLYKPDEYPTVPMSRYFKNFWVEFYYVMAKFYLLPLKWVNLNINQNQQSETSILLIHGYCRQQVDWLWMRKQLATLKIPVFCVNLQPQLAKIEEITAQSLPAKIQQIVAQTQCKKIILIGHSMGGLVSAYYSEFMDQQNLIKSVITIGSPIYGTKVSIMGAGENATQMCPGSAFLHELHAAMHKSPKSYYQIGSKLDNMIFPWQSALFEHSGASKQVVLPHSAHLSMLNEKEVAAQLQKWLGELVEK